MRILLLIFTLLLNDYAWSEQIEQISKPSTNNSINNNLHYPASGMPVKPNNFEPIINNTVSAVESKVNNNNNQTENWKQDEGWIYKVKNDPVAMFTFFLVIATFLLWKSTRDLVVDAKETSKRQSRAFVFIDGFNVELTTATNIKIAIEDLPKIYQSSPELFIARFAVQPKWKNSGNTPTKNMNIHVNWQGPEGGIPPEYVYKTDPQKVFLAPNSTELGEVIEIPSIKALVDFGLTKIGVEPMVLIWGRADYEDIFGTPHYVKWCYRIRLENHKGEGLRAGFIQWGNYNRSDEYYKS
jgi:hypothetical protein